MNINYSIQQSNPQTFTASFIRKEAVVAYKQLPPEFLKKVEEKGVTQGLLVSFINRLLLKPNANKLTPEKLGKALTQKINQLFGMLKKNTPTEDIAKTLKTDKKRIIAFIHKQELIKRNNEIAEEFLNGESINSLAERHNLSIKAIGLILKAKGISPKNIANERRNKVVQMVNENFTDELIADTTGYSLKQIHSIRVHNRLHKNKSKEPKPRELLIIEQLKSGKRREHIAEQLGVSINIIHNVSRKFKVKENMQTERDNNVLELLQDNIPAKTIAKIFNIDKATVYRIAKKYNFKLS